MLLARSPRLSVSNFWPPVSQALHFVHKTTLLSSFDPLLLGRNAFAAILSQLILDSLDPIVTGLREPLLLPAEGRSVILIFVDNLFAAVEDHLPFLWRA